MNIISKLYFLSAPAFMLILSGTSQAQDHVFKTVCSECHTGGFKAWISGAPNVHDPNEWKPYIQRDSLERMKEIVLLGTDKHKRKGGCGSCSQADIENSITYMIDLVRPAS